MSTLVRFPLSFLLLAFVVGCGPVPAEGIDVERRLDRAERIDAQAGAVAVRLPDWQRAPPDSSGPFTRSYRWTTELAQVPDDLALFFPGFRAYGQLVVNGATVFDNRASARSHLPRGPDVPLLVNVSRDRWRAGTNTIELHALGTSALGVSALELGPNGLLLERRRYLVLATVVGPALVAAVITTLGASMLYLWLRRRESIYGYFGAGMLGWALHTSWSLLPLPILPPLHLQVWWNALYVCFVALLVMFCLRYAEVRWRWLERALWAFVLATPPVLYAALLIEPRSGFASYWRLLLIGTVAMGVAAIVQAARRAPGRDRALIVLIGLASLAASGHDWWIARQGLDNNPVYLVPYIGLLFGAFVMRVLIDRFLASAHAVETMNLELERRVAAQNVELREALSQMRAARDDAQTANEAKTRFLAAASHDLRQPAHALGLYVANLRRQPMSPAQDELVTRIAGSVDALHSMLGALLDISRIDAGAVARRSERIALGPLLRRLADEYAPQCEARGLRLALHVPPGSPAAETDGEHLERIVRNLLANAVRYTNRGGILLACRARTRPDGMRCWRIEVWDTGVGIGPVAQTRVFEEYYQVGNPGRDRQRGLGLGLAIVRRLADLLGLSVSLRSRLGHGSVFAVAGLPVTGIDETVPADVRAQEQPAALQGRTVALIEDDRDVRAAMRLLLQQWGCRVVEGDDADEVLQHTRSAAADAVIADMRLAGGREGIVEVDRLRTRWGSALPVLVVTGEVAPQRVQALEQAGLSWLSKPVAPAVLREWLSRALDAGIARHRESLP